MICTTLNKIRDHDPCCEGWEKLLKHLGKTKADDAPLPLVTILDSNGLDDCLWCLRSVPEHDREWRLFAVWCARQAQHLMTDPRSREALDVAEAFANGKATTEDLKAAYDAADAAYAAYAAAYVAGAADAAAYDAADAARAAAYDAAYAAYAARAAAYAARAAQTAKLREIIAQVQP